MSEKFSEYFSQKTSNSNIVELNLTELNEIYGGLWDRGDWRNSFSQAYMIVSGGVTGFVFGGPAGGIVGAIWGGVLYSIAADPPFCPGPKGHPKKGK